MSANPLADAKVSFDLASRANEHHASWMMSFQAACMRHDWEAADIARFGVIESIDLFMENFAAGHKRMERV